MVDEAEGSGDLDAEVDAALAACGGNARAAIKAMLILQSFYQAEVQRYEAEVERLTEAVSNGFTRGRVRGVEAKKAG